MAANYKTDQEWRDAINATGDPARQAQLKKDYARWTDLGGESQIALPEDFRTPEGGAKNFSGPNGMEDARRYVESILPKIQANYGNNDRASYEAEKKRLERAVSSGNLNPQEHKKAEMLLADLNNHYRDSATKWLTEDLRNAKSNADASKIQAELDTFKRNAIESDPKQQMVADVLSGGTGFGDAGGWDGSLEWQGNQLGQPIMDQFLKGWNDVPLSDAYDTVGQQIVDNAKLRGQEQLGYYDQAANRSIGNLTDANKAATDQTNKAIAALEGSGTATKDQINQLISGLQGKQALTDTRADASLKGVTDAFGKFGSERDAATKDYLASLAPLQKQLEAQGYTGISTSADDIGRLLDSYGNLKENALHGADQLKDVYGRYKEQADQEGMTAQERAILEAANRNQARAMKSQQDATMASLRTRGMLSGGNVMSANAAMASNLGDDRIAATLQALASAQQRQQQALAGMRGTAGDIASTNNTAGANLFTGANQIRTGNDAMAQFNKTQEGITTRFQDQYKQDEAKRLQGLAQDKQNTMLTKTTGDFDASSSLNRDTQDALDRAFGRSTQTTNTGLTGAQNRYAIDAGLAGEKTSAADREANRAGNLANTELTSATNRTNLIGSTGKDEDEALRYLLSLKAEKQALKTAGGSL